MDPLSVPVLKTCVDVWSESNPNQPVYVSTGKEMKPVYALMHQNNLWVHMEGPMGQTPSLRELATWLNALTAPFGPIYALVSGVSWQYQVVRVTAGGQDPHVVLELSPALREDPGT